MYLLCELCKNASESIKILYNSDDAADTKFVCDKTVLHCLFRTRINREMIQSGGDCV